MVRRGAFAQSWTKIDVSSEVGLLRDLLLISTGIDLHGHNSSERIECYGGVHRLVNPAAAWWPHLPVRPSTCYKDVFVPAAFPTALSLPISPPFYCTAPVVPHACMQSTVLSWPRGPCPTSSCPLSCLTRPSFPLLDTDLDGRRRTGCRP